MEIRWLICFSFLSFLFPFFSFLISNLSQIRVLFGSPWCWGCLGRRSVRADHFWLQNESRAGESGEKRSRNAAVTANLLARGESRDIARCRTDRAASARSERCRASIALYQWDKDKCGDKRVGFASPPARGYQKSARHLDFFIPLPR